MKCQIFVEEGGGEVRNSYVNDPKVAGEGVDVYPFSRIVVLV